MAAVADGTETAPSQTFLFADLAGFTALTEAHGDEQAADLVDAFCARVRELLREHGAEEVKAIGDALMLRADDAGQAMRLALRVAGEIGGAHAFPAVRVGAHTGPAVARGRDWFGATVNLASRVSTAAAAGEVLVTRATRDAAGAPAGIAFRARGAMRFKNVARPVEVFAAETAAAPLAPRTAIDPVCQMAVDPVHAEARSRHRGADYHFCSEACALAFEASPERYVGRSSRADLRVSDSARERAVGALRRAYERGRLSLDELDERLSHAYAARTRRELRAVLGDLPEYRRMRREGRRARRRRRWRALLPWRRRR